MDNECDLFVCVQHIVDSVLARSINQSRCRRPGGLAIWHVTTSRSGQSGLWSLHSAATSAV